MKAKRAFTLIEMLVVVGILALLLAVLIGKCGGALESARAAKCLTNMKNLALGCQTYGMATGVYPYAGSSEMTFNSGGASVAIIGRAGVQYEERPGWISWFSNGAYGKMRDQGLPNFSTTHISSPSWHLSTYYPSSSQSDKLAHEYCLTNGTIWRCVSGNRSIYLCPEHKAEQGVTPTWSYVMNCNFYADEYNGSAATETSTMSSPYPFALGYGFAGSDKVLMFAEMQFTKLNGQPAPTRNTSPGPENDCVLQVKSTGNFPQMTENYSGNCECIGFNHKANNSRCAHVVFMDGHTEKLMYPKNGLSKSDWEKLTTWLCNGVGVSLSGNRYVELH